MKIFITGSSGFIGRHVVTKALQAGHRVVGLRFSNATSKYENHSSSMTWITGSLEDDMKYALDGCDALIHLAAYGVDPRYDSWQEAFRWNVTASIKVIEEAHLLNIKRVIFIGSCSEYGKSAERYEYIPCDAPLEPVNAYGASKAAATLAALAYARENNLEVAVLRPFHVYGEGEGHNRFWPSMKKAALDGKNFQMTNGEQIRDFTPVDLVANLILEYATEKQIMPGNPIIRNLGTGIPKSLKDFATECWNEFGAKGKLIPGAIQYRKDEIMRYVPDLKEHKDTQSA